MGKKIVVVLVLFSVIIFFSACRDRLNNTSKETSINPDSKSTEITHSDFSDKEIETEEEEKLKEAIDNVKADDYYVEEFISSYIWSLTDAVNENNFNLVDHKLDEKSKIYNIEKDYVRDTYAKGTKLKLINYTFDEIKYISENDCKVYVTVEHEITNSDDSTEKRISQRVFTVFDDGEMMKIINIEQIE